MTTHETGRYVTLRRRLRHYYTSYSPQARRFRYALLAFDVFTIAFIIATSFLPRNDLIEGLDAVFGIAILVEFCARIYSSRGPFREFLYLTTWTDAVAIVSFLAPILGEGAGFLRVLRTVRLLRTYHLLHQLRRDVPYFRRHEDVILASVNLGVFLFIMTAVVYETQHLTNPQIQNYVDALYFTITTLTTTGFGDITLQGTGGRLIAVAIMILGVTLFLNLVRTLLKPSKVRHRCPSCGLMRHDYDAVHCKACGNLLNLADEGKL